MMMQATSPIMVMPPCKPKQVKPCIKLTTTTTTTTMRESRASAANSNSAGGYGNRRKVVHFQD
jgi:hypothetical protein